MIAYMLQAAEFDKDVIKILSDVSILGLENAIAL